VSLKTFKVVGGRFSRQMSHEKNHLNIVFHSCLFLFILTGENEKRKKNH
jgi:hypothetical protein